MRHKDREINLALLSHAQKFSLVSAPADPPPTTNCPPACSLPAGLPLQTLTTVTSRHAFATTPFPSMQSDTTHASPILLITPRVVPGPRSMAASSPVQPFRDELVVKTLQRDHAWTISLRIVCWSFQIAHHYLCHPDGDGAHWLPLQG